MKEEIERRLSEDSKKKGRGKKGCKLTRHTVRIFSISAGGNARIIEDALRPLSLSGKPYIKKECESE